MAYRLQNPWRTPATNVTGQVTVDLRNSLSSVGSARYSLTADCLRDSLNLAGLFDRLTEGLGLRKIFDNFNIRTWTTGTSFNCSIRFSDSSFEFELGYILEFILETINSLKRRNALATGNYTVHLSLTNPPNSSSFLSKLQFTTFLLHVSDRVCLLFDREVLNGPSTA